jgi:hypothetical protein
MPPSKLNPRGFFESEPIFRLHDELFEEAGTSWSDLQTFPKSWLDSPMADVYIERMLEVVREEFGDSPLFVVKDPRLCRLVPYWQRVLARLDVEPAYVIAIRNPLEVAASLKHTQEVPEAKGLLLWLQYVLQAEHDSRKHTRCFVSYDQLLTDWRTVIGHVGRELSLTFPRLSRRAAAEADEFVTKALRHHRQTASDVELREDVVGWIKDVHTWVNRAAEGKPGATRKLDQIRAAYDAAEGAFGPLLVRWELQRDESVREAEQLNIEMTQLSGELGELKGQLVPAREELTQLEERLVSKEGQVSELVDCIRLMLIWIAKSTPGGNAASERLETLLQGLDGAESQSLREVATEGLQRYEHSIELQRLEEQSRSTVEEAERLQSEARTLQEELQTRSIEAEALLHQLGEQQADGRALQQSLDAVTAELDEAQTQIQTYGTELDPLRDAYRAAQIECERLRGVELAQTQELERLRGAELAQTQELERLRGVELAQTQELERLRGVELAQAQELEQLRGVESEMAGELERLHREARTLGGELDQRREVERAHTKELEHLRSVEQVQAGKLERLLEQHRSEATEEARLRVLRSDTRAAERARLEEELNAAYGEIQRMHGLIAGLRREITHREAQSETASVPGLEGQGSGS